MKSPGPSRKLTLKRIPMRTSAAGSVRAQQVTLELFVAVDGLAHVGPLLVIGAGEEAALESGDDHVGDRRKSTDYITGPSLLFSR